MFRVLVFALNDDTCERSTLPLTVQAPDPMVNVAASVFVAARSPLTDTVDGLFVLPSIVTPAPRSAMLRLPLKTGVPVR